MPYLTDEERIGTTISGKYVLDGVIGRGGMGTVFAGHHALSSRAVAVKVLHPQHVRDPVAVRRFLNEARTAAAFRHANVVDVLDVDVLDDGTVFLVLELLDGETVGELLSRVGKLSVSETLSIVVPVLRALGHAHRLNIVHRDLKPDNIFLTPGKTCAFPVLLDFGIAKMLDGPEQSIETVTGTIIGTPQYMAPEQALGSSENTPQLDIYAMGVVVFECLAGERPIDGNNPAAVLAKLVTGQVPKLKTIAPDVSDGMSAIVAKALATNASDRYDSCDSFADALLAEARAEGFTVELPLPTDKLSASEGARTQRLRAITDSTARRALKKSASDPPASPAPTLGEHELASARASIANRAVDSDARRGRSAHSTIAPTTAQRTARTTPASMIGAMLAFVVVGAAGVATLQRAPDPPRQSSRVPTMATSDRAASAERTAPQVPALQPATLPSANIAPMPATTPDNAHTTSDAGAVTVATNVRRPLRASGAAASAVAQSTATNSAQNAPAIVAQPTSNSSTSTARTTQRNANPNRPPEVTNVW